MKFTLQLLPPLFFLAFVSTNCIAQQGTLQAAYNARGSGNYDADSELRAYFFAGRSYECVILTRFYDMGMSPFYVFNNVIDPNSNSVTVTSNGSLYPPVSTPSVITAEEQNRTRVAIVAETTGDYRFTLMDVEGINGDNFTAVPSCRETTLFGSYNRFFAQLPIVELENRSTADIPVAISIINSAGTTIVDKQPAVARASTRTDVIFSELPASDLGQIVITHSAPFGALSGTVSEYDFGSGGEITLKRERPLKVAEKN